MSSLKAMRMSPDDATQKRPSRASADPKVRTGARTASVAGARHRTNVPPLPGLPQAVEPQHGDRRGGVEPGPSAQLERQPLGVSPDHDGDPSRI